MRSQAIRTRPGVHLSIPYRYCEHIDIEYQQNIVTTLRNKSSSPYKVPLNCFWIVVSLTRMPGPLSMWLHEENSFLVICIVSWNTNKVIAMDFANSYCSIVSIFFSEWWYGDNCLCLIICLFVCLFICLFAYFYCNTYFQFSALYIITYLVSL